MKLILLKLFNYIEIRLFWYNYNAFAFLMIPKIQIKCEESNALFKIIDISGNLNSYF
jgi:hypothetical protein